MKNILKISSLILVLSFIVSCSSQQDKENIAKVEALIQETQTYVEQLEATDSVSISEHYKKMMHHIEYLQLNLTDSIPTPLIAKLSDYRAHRKTYQFYGKKFSSTLKDAKLEVKQLEALKKDIENNIVDENKFDNYYQLEASNVGAIAENTIKMVESIEKSEEVYAEISPVADSLMKAVMARNQVETTE